MSTSTVGEMNSSIPRPIDAMTARKAINALRRKVKNASPGVHIFYFNVFEEELERAYSLLDKEEHRRAMRITYNDEFNFVIRFTDSAVHAEAVALWSLLVCNRLTALIPESDRPALPPGCTAIGGSTHQVGPRRKEADDGIRPLSSLNPSILFEVGSSETSKQLRIDAKLWVEHLPEVQLVMLLFIDPATADPTPKISVELWRGVLVGSQNAQTKEGHMVWQDDWTHNAAPLYILLADLFRGEVPTELGAYDRIFLASAAWRQRIIETYHLFLTI